jgi:hypothetical protein
LIVISLRVPISDVPHSRDDTGKNAAADASIHGGKAVAGKYAIVGNAGADP